MGNISVLLIEDDERIKDVVEEYLKEFGYQVITAADGEEGLEKFKNNQVDIVLTDLGLPKLTGLEVTKKIKEINPEIPVIMATGHNLEKNKEEILSSGVDIILSKPGPLNDIVNSIQKLIEPKK